MCCVCLCVHLPCTNMLGWNTRQTLCNASYHCHQRKITCYLLIELVEYSLHHTVSNKALSSLLTADYKNMYSVLIKCDENKEYQKKKKENPQVCDSRRRSHRASKPANTHCTNGVSPLWGCSVWKRAKAIVQWQPLCWRLSGLLPWKVSQRAAEG